MKRKHEKINELKLFSCIDFSGILYCVWFDYLHLFIYLLTRNLFYPEVYSAVIQFFIHETSKQNEQINLNQ